MSVERDIDRHAAAGDDWEAFCEWCDEEGRDPEDDDARSDYDAEMDERRAEAAISELEYDRGLETGRW